MDTLDAIELQVFRHLLAAIPEEMGVALERSAFSPNIKERRDFSCAVTDQRGGLAAQASHIPVHLGSAHVTAADILRSVKLVPGDAVLLNDPYRGGTHLPDVTVFVPVFLEGAPRLGVLVRAHHADVGGAHPGSMGPANDLFGEGIVVPPVRLVRGGVMDDDVLQLFLANTRTPLEREGDLRAQLAAAELGQRRLNELATQYGNERVLLAVDALQDHAARATRAMLRGLNDGEATAVDHLDGPDSAAIRVALKKRGATLAFDFTGTDPAVRGPFNANRAITLSAVFYAVRLLLDEDLPTNAGCLRPIKVTIESGSLLDPPRHSAVAMGNVETSQRLVDVVLAALAKLAPDRIPAASQGTMNNLSVGGRNASGAPFTFYETLGGGAGAGPLRPGESGIQCHMTNTLNTPIEAMEAAYPVRVTAYHLRSGSGGAGRHRGGDGLVREIEALEPMDVTVMASRRDVGPSGTAGGEPGAPGRDRVRVAGTWRPFPTEGTVRLMPGDRVRIETPGGGGFGRA